MFKLLGVIALVTVCFAEAAAQVPVPPPINVPAPVNSSHITISREIMRIEAKRAGRRNSRQRKRVNAAKSPTSNPPINTSPTSKSPTSKSPNTTPKVSVIDPPPPSSADAKISNTDPAALARQMPDIYGPYLANFSRLRILQKNDQLSSTGGSARKRSVGQNETTRAAGGLTAQDTSFHASQPPFVPQQLAARIGETQQERQYVEGVFTKCLNYYVDNAIRNRVPLNDVARALNYFISTNYFVYSSGAGPTPQQMNATRDLIRANMTRDDAFRTMSDKQKQEAYETLIVLAGFVDLGAGTARQSGDAKAAAQFREMAKYNLETLLGAPIEKIHFTNDGLALK